MVLTSLVGFQVDGDEFGAVGDDVLEEGCAGVEKPEAVVGVDDYGLDADEVSLVGGRVLEGVGVGELAAGPVVELFVGIGDGFAVDDFGDGEGDIVAPAGEVYEDAAGVGDGDAFGHGAVEGGYGFELAQGAVGGGLLGGGGGYEQREGEAEEGSAVHRLRWTMRGFVLLAAEISDAWLRCGRRCGGPSLRSG